jgi:hypothetical protein
MYNVNGNAQEEEMGGGQGRAKEEGEYIPENQQSNHLL